jgi:hypothetical protein
MWEGNPVTFGGGATVVLFMASARPATAVSSMSCSIFSTISEYSVKESCGFPVAPGVNAAALALRLFDAIVQGWVRGDGSIGEEDGSCEDALSTPESRNHLEPERFDTLGFFSISSGEQRR